MNRMNTEKGAPVVAATDIKIICADKKRKSIECFAIKAGRWTPLPLTIHDEKIDRVVAENGHFYVLCGQFIEKFDFSLHCWQTVNLTNFSEFCDE